MAGLHDFQEIRTPILERTSLFARGIGDATDIVEKEMYTFADKGGDSLTLRPEATAGIVRAVIERGMLESGGRPLKLFALGPMFRYERPQMGRQRQFHQLDAEVFQDPGPLVDAEVIGFLWAFLRELGLGGLTLSLNSLGCPQCRPRHREALVKYYQGEEKALCPDCQRRLSHNPLRLLDCKNSDCRALAGKAPVMKEFLCPECGAHIEGVSLALTDLGLAPVWDSTLVRGLDYYCRTAFEVLSGDLGAQNAVAGGGRYDGLVSALGGPDAPAVGFAVGLERLALLLKERAGLSAAGPDYYVAILDPAALGPAFRLTGALRARGFTVAADWEAGSLKSRLRRADKIAAKKVIMLGADEIASGQATVRDLLTKEQASAPFADPEAFA
jgi:histidyl-tRNA synthetase